MSTQSDAEVAADVFAAAFLKVLQTRLRLVMQVKTLPNNVTQLTTSLFYVDPDAPDKDVFITMAGVDFGIDAPPLPLPRIVPR